MSRWWRDEIRALLAPGGVELIRAGSGFTRKFQAAREHALAEPSDWSDWRPAVEALEEQLRTAQWRNAELAVELSNHFVRYGVIGWDDALRNEAEVLAYAQHHLRSMYGESANAWEACMSDALPGKQRVLAAIDRSLMEALRSLADRFSLRLAHVEPMFAAAVNAHSERLTDSAFYVAVVERSRVCIGRAGPAGWIDVYNMRAVDPPAALAGFLRQEMLQNAEDTFRRIYVVGSESQTDSRVAADGWDVVTLERAYAGGRPGTRTARIIHAQAA